MTMAIHVVVFDKQSLCVVTAAGVELSDIGFSDIG
jgi:hypothetical protein